VFFPVFGRARLPAEPAPRTIVVSIRPTAIHIGTLAQCRGPTDLSSRKPRPVIVISNDAYNRSAADVVMVAMTSNPAPSPYSFVIDEADLAQGTLNRPGTVRADKIYTLEKSLIVKTFGRVRAKSDHRPFIEGREQHVATNNGRVILIWSYPPTGDRDERLQYH
jgi:mRNA interferase MazF